MFSVGVFTSAAKTFRASSSFFSSFLLLCLTVKVEGVKIEQRAFLRGKEGAEGEKTMYSTAFARFPLLLF